MIFPRHSVYSVAFGKTGNVAEETGLMPRGTVTEYDLRTARGMLRDAESGRMLAFDRKSLADPFFSQVLSVGQQVSFGVIRDGLGERAIQVRPLL